MTVTLNLKPEVEAGLVAQVLASGMAFEEYVLSVIEKIASAEQPEAHGSKDQGRKEAVRQMLEFGDKYHLSLGDPITRKLL